MNCSNNLNGCEIVTLANIISVYLSQNLTSDELALLAGFFTILGDNLATISLTCNSENSKKI